MANVYYALPINCIPWFRYELRGIQTVFRVDTHLWTQTRETEGN